VSISCRLDRVPPETSQLTPLNTALSAYGKIASDMTDTKEKTWKISVRSQKDRQVNASNVDEGDGFVTFTDTLGVVVGKFSITHLQGYSVEFKQPPFTVVVSSVLDRDEPDHGVTSRPDDNIWEVLLPLKKVHRLLAVTAKENEGGVTFIDADGLLAGKFYLSDVQGYSVVLESSSEPLIADPQDALL
jgi:hypothetical protein